MMPLMNILTLSRLRTRPRGVHLGLTFAIVALLSYVAVSHDAAASQASEVSTTDLMEQLKEKVGRHRYQPVSVIDTRTFCTALHTQFSKIADHAGLNSVDQLRFADTALPIVLDHMAAGHAAPLLDLSALAAVANLKLPEPSQNHFLSVSEILSYAIGAPQNTALALGSDELKYLPIHANGTDIIVITNSAAELNEHRARRVGSLAREKQTRIHTVWTGTSSNLDEKRTMAWLSATTGGYFTDLTLSRQLCNSSL